MLELNKPSPGLQRNQVLRFVSSRKSSSNLTPRHTLRLYHLSLTEREPGKAMSKEEAMEKERIVTIFGTQSQVRVCVGRLGRCGHGP